MNTPISESAQKVQAALAAMNLPCQVVELPGSTRTAQDAAAAIGCTVAQIVKSLIFKTRHSHQPVLVLASGVNRVSENRLAELAGEEVEKADADFVRLHTGFAIGGVPPLGHLVSIMTFWDEDLLAFNEIWAAAGTPHAVFRLTPQDLQRITGSAAVNIH